MNRSNDQALPYTVEGPADAPALVFVHGWPDDPSLWRHQVSALSDTYRCVLPTLPNFGDSPSEAGGCDFGQIVDRLHQTILALGDAPVILVTHDWGAYIGYLYEKQYPERVSTMIAMDIGGHVQPSTVSAIAMFVSYQWTLIALWLIGGVIPQLGSWLTMQYALLLKVPERQARAIRSRCNYPYFYFWRANLVPWLRSRLIGRYRPQCPLLFIYGGKKPLMFHTERWLDIVEKTGGKSACIEDGAHWFMETHAEQTNHLMHDWLASRAA